MKPSAEGARRDGDHEGRAVPQARRHLLPLGEAQERDLSELPARGVRVLALAAANACAEAVVLYALETL